MRKVNGPIIIKYLNTQMFIDSGRIHFCGWRVWAIPGSTLGSAPEITSGRLWKTHGMPGINPGLVVC